MARARAGDHDAFALLVTRYTPLARRTAQLTGAGDDAEDVVQEAFTKALRGLGGFRDGGAFRPWLLRIVVNETRNLHRGGLRRARREDFVQNGVALLEHSSEEQALAGITREGLLDAVRGLPERDRAVIVCRYFLDLSEAETAEVLGVPRGTVKSRHSRALERLRRAATVLALVLAAVGVAAAVSPQVRAAIERVLRFAGVEVHHGSLPAPAPPPSPTPNSLTLPGEHVTSLAEARRAVRFPVTVPPHLGPPLQVTVSDGGRVVSLVFAGSGAGQTARLDEFDGRLSDVFTKIAYGNDPVDVTVDGAAGWWIAGPQDVVYLDRTGQAVTATAHRTDGTLVWQAGDVSYRLEGIADRAEAVRAASG
ncbi:sigma-70 family RNA polymerase sigma factor [Catenulispora subtropica]|uniref:RNA polymerase, sigma-24 subunit, ECF subfamily n=1 Tax=Catenulispora subtropica TaxID=450798 RepID=A0ABN2T7Z5_9ACTN